jgi:hypothetical protein
MKHAGRTSVACWLAPLSIALSLSGCGSRSLLGSPDGGGGSDGGTAESITVTYRVTGGLAGIDFSAEVSGRDVTAGSCRLRLTEAQYQELLARFKRVDASSVLSDYVPDPLRCIDEMYYQLAVSHVGSSEVHDGFTTRYGDCEDNIPEALRAFGGFLARLLDVGSAATASACQSVGLGSSCDAAAVGSNIAGTCLAGQVCITAASPGDSTSTCELSCTKNEDCPEGFRCNLPPLVPDSLGNVCVQ